MNATSSSQSVLMSDCTAFHMPMTAVTMGETRDIVDEDSNPETLLIRKVEGLAALLGCSEQEAQRLLFSRCEAF
jgi:hypothetical protein